MNIAINNSAGAINTVAATMVLCCLFLSKDGPCTLYKYIPPNYTSIIGFINCGLQRFYLKAAFVLVLFCLGGPAPATKMWFWRGRFPWSLPVHKASGMKMEAYFLLYAAIASCRT